MAEYIERGAAIESIISEPPDAHYPQWYAEKIKSIPSANVAPVRHGRWIGYHEADIGYDEYGVRCSNCDFEVEDHEVDFVMNYCPNCGARMDLEEPNEAKESRQP